MLRQIELRAREQPLLMVFEDAHWSDPTSRELLDLIVPRMASLPVLLLVTFRPEFQPPWSGAAHVTTMTLNRLDRRELSALVQRIVTNSILSDAVVAEILERTEGVPLFIEELTKTMLEGAGNAGESIFPVPSSLQASLLARLDRLPAAKHVAQIGSVIGREFSHELLAEVAMFIEATLLQGLDELVLTGLAFRRGIPPDATYMFKHVLVQETAYSTLLRRRRQELHARITTVLEENNPEIVEQQPELLAHHCAQAGLIEKAIAYLSRAGRQSLARSATAEAVAQLRKGLELLSGLPDGPDRWERELELQSTLGAALVASPRKFRARDRTGLHPRARTLRAARGYQYIGSSAQRTEHLSSNPQRVWRNAFGCRRLVAPGTSAASHSQSFGRQPFHGSVPASSRIFHSAQIHFQEVNKLYIAGTHNSLASVAAFDMRAVALTYLSLASFILGDVEQAESLSAQALTWSRNLRHPHNLAFALCYAALLKMLGQSDPEATELLDELTALTTEHHFPAYLAVANILRGRLISARGRSADGLALMRKGMSEIASAGASWNQTYFLGLLALTCENAGFADEAFDALARALEHADSY